jgi:hypothetical protein
MEVKIMRLCKIPNLEYPKFEQIRDAIYSTIPFAVIHVGYSPKLKLGIFNFWDSDYIPEEMKQFIMQPPLSRENRELMTKALKDAI